MFEDNGYKVYVKCVIVPYILNPSAVDILSKAGKKLVGKKLYARCRFPGRQC